MQLLFRIHYKTTWGEELRVVLTLPGTPKATQLTVPLQSKDGLYWTGQTDVLLTSPTIVTYQYEVLRNKSVYRKEYHTLARELVLNPSARTYYVRDMWRDLPDEAYLYSSAVTNVLRKRAVNKGYQWPLFNHTLILRAQTPRPHTGQTLYICGEGSALGNWKTDNAHALTETAPNEWTLVLNADNILPQAAYKFLIKENNEIVWEEGENRRLPEITLKNQEVWVENDLRPKFTEKNPLRAAGVVLPVFSIRTEGSWGIGDFGDLAKLIDWASKTGQKVIQILPINDTTITHTWKDSYPYNAVSVYALHPIYADIRALPVEVNKQWEIQRRVLNTLPRINYEDVLSLKLTRLREAFKNEGAKILKTNGFRQFLIQNLHWLPPYAMFCTLRDTYKTADYTSWPQHSRFSYRNVVEFCKETSPHYKEVAFWYYVQYILHTQLLSAATKAREHGIILKGDIPIGISPHSVEAWQEPKLFNLNTQAGAPPDDFSVTGQNWGFPTYNWNEMAKDNYRWWMRRFTHMARYFDAYRIDHVLGFFRIWEIPTHSVQGLLGQFSPALPMDASEIGRFGLAFRPEFLTPYISEDYLKEKMGDFAEETKQTYLLSDGNGHYRLRPEFDTQRKVEKVLEGITDEDTLRLKEGLFALISNVLFVQDRLDPNKYHPRIAALTDGYFKSLSAADKRAFENLYNDYFYRRHNQFWAEKALEKLPALTQATRLLACAEDLGMIPACVPEVMKELQMLSLEIQRMPKTPGKLFADTTHYPYTSVATPSTHDMSVLRGWWTENASVTQKFWTNVLGKKGQAPKTLDGKTCEEIINLHLNSPSMLALISYQDWTGMDESLRESDPEEERINIPANPHHYWRYRMPITVEELLEKTEFNTKIKELIQFSKR